MPDGTRPTTARGDVILVGHSLGGLTIPVVAEHRPVAGLIFLCAFLPDPGKPMQVDPDTFSPAWAALSAHQVTHDDGTTSWPHDAAIQAFFHDMPVRPGHHRRPPAAPPVVDARPTRTTR